MLCDDGTTYEITDLQLWEEPEPLPVLTRDWPELELPEMEVRRFRSEYGDNLHIRNLYETRRMEYTLYNAAMDCPELWEDGAPTLNLHLGISAQNAVQMFWPWQEDQLTQVFRSAPGPGSRWKPGMCTTTGNISIPNIISEGCDLTASQTNRREAASLPLFA